MNSFFDKIVSYLEEAVDNAVDEAVEDGIDSAFDYLVAKGTKSLSASVAADKVGEASGEGLGGGNKSIEKGGQSTQSTSHDDSNVIFSLPDDELFKSLDYKWTSYDDATYTNDRTRLWDDLDFDSDSDFDWEEDLDEAPVVIDKLELDGNDLTVTDKQGNEHTHTLVQNARAPSPSSSSVTSHNESTVV